MHRSATRRARPAPWTRDRFRRRVRDARQIGLDERPAAQDFCEQPPLVLTNPTRWEAVGDPVDEFSQRPIEHRTSIGIGFFPLRGTGVAQPCGLRPAVGPIAELPALRPYLDGDRLTMPYPTRRPFLPAGAITYVQAYGRARRDGLRPSSCNGRYSKRLQQLDPGRRHGRVVGADRHAAVKDVVVGLGADGEPDEIALAGSGGTVHYFPISGDVATTPGGTRDMRAAPLRLHIAGNGMIDPHLLNVSR